MVSTIKTAIKNGVVIVNWFPKGASRYKVIIISLIKKISVAVVLITNGYMSAFLLVFFILTNPEQGLLWVFWSYN